MVRNYYPFGYSGYQFLESNNTHYIQSELLPDNSIRVIECDIDEKWMKVRERKEKSEEWKEIDLSDLQRCDTIDLSENGDRWEGVSLNGNPFGYGCVYDSDNQLIYKGFVFEGMKVCYENVFYGDTGIIEDTVDPQSHGNLIQSKFQTLNLNILSNFYFSFVFIL